MVATYYDPRKAHSTGFKPWSLKCVQRQSEVPGLPVGGPSLKHGLCSAFLLIGICVHLRFGTTNLKGNPSMSVNMWILTCYNIIMCTVVWSSPSRTSFFILHLVNKYIWRIFCAPSIPLFNTLFDYLYTLANQYSFCSCHLKQSMLMLLQHSVHT